MSDIIHLLPDSVANQIAAGEVIQRPASVVKELVENALDAGADFIQIVIKDAGRTLIQVIDNGKGMSETDARMSFERHATSKIKNASDLFALQTMGFRGEALASIAAIAQVELRTKKADEELGSLIEMSGSNVEKQELIQCPNGSNFSVKNLFFNVPARRKFLKTNTTEFSHILTEFHRVAIIYPHIAFSLIHNDTVIYQLSKSQLLQRITAIFGKSIGAQLLPIEVETSLVKISGFVGKPESARKQMNHQYFFVNGRYMRHPYFHKAVMQALDRMLSPETSPSYFISFEIDPASIDINIHPTKTEIKFENEQAIWTIIMSAVKEALGKFNVVPGIDFNQEGSIDIPVFSKNEMPTSAPKTNFNPSYNPFKSSGASYKRESMDWEKLYDGFEKDKQFTVTPENTQEKLFSSDLETNEDYESLSKNFFQLRERYIITAIKSGLLLVDQHRAHVRILFEQYISAIEQKKSASQKTLFPEVMELSAEDAAILTSIKEDLHFIGFEIDDFGKNAFVINGIPATIESNNTTQLLGEIIASCRENPNLVKDTLHENLALSLANTTAIPYGQTLSKEEMEYLVDKLFACKNYNYTPKGKIIFSIIDYNDLVKKF